MHQIDIVEIMDLLPHRYPFLLIDKIIEFIPNDRVVAIKNVTANEPQFTGHFPHKPVMPGVLIIEAMAQSAAVLVTKSQGVKKDNDVYFMSIEHAKFRKVVAPGDTMYIYCNIKQSRAQVWKFDAVAKVDEQVVAESSFTAMIKPRTAA
jgi:3-hydroxyacyl-[acyl-carrier-protein] dehydratase